MDISFWILACGFLILDFGFRIVVVSVLFVAAPHAAIWNLDFRFFGFLVLDLGLWISHLGFRISERCSLRSFCGSPTRSYLEFGFQFFWISGFGFGIVDISFGILDCGFLIWDFGFRIVVVSVLFVAAPHAAIWNLDFRFFGFLVLDLGLWISHLGFWLWKF